MEDNRQKATDPNTSGDGGSADINGEAVHKRGSPMACSRVLCLNMRCYFRKLSWHHDSAKFLRSIERVKGFESLAYRSLAWTCEISKRDNQNNAWISITNARVSRISTILSQGR